MHLYNLLHSCIIVYDLLLYRSLIIELFSNLMNCPFCEQLCNDIPISCIQTAQLAIDESKKNKRMYFIFKIVEKLFVGFDEQFQLFYIETLEMIYHSDPCDDSRDSSDS